MRNLLEKILSPIRTLAATAIITATIAGMSREAYADSSKSFEYFTQSRNITNINVVSPAEKGLVRESSSKEIKSIGNYQEETRAPRITEDIKIDVAQENNKLNINYSCIPKRFNERTPVYEQMLREDSTNTHIYFLLPKNVVLKKEFQLISGVNNRTFDQTTHIGTPFEDTKLCKAIKNINIAIEEGAKPLESDKQELERLFDNTIDLIGGPTEKGIEIIKAGMKWTLNKAEKKRIEDIRKIYGEECQIHKMSFHQIDGPVFKYTYFGRISSLILDTSEVVEGNKAYIVIPNLTFTQDIAGTTRNASLEGLVYEIPLERFIQKKEEKKTSKEYSKEDLYKKYSEEKRREILEGKWESDDGKKTVEINFERGRNYLRVWGDWRAKGTYEEKLKDEREITQDEKEWNKKFMIVHDNPTGNSSEHRLFLDDMNPNWESSGPKRTKTFDIVTPEVIKEVPEGYLIREGTTKEKLDSIKSLMGDEKGEGAKKILNGKWNSLNGDKIIEINFFENFPQPKEKGRIVVEGTYKENRNKEYKITKHYLVNNSSNHQFFFDGYEERNIKEDDSYSSNLPGKEARVIKIITPNIINEAFSDYFIKEGTPIEKIDSLEDLVGIWKLEESFLRTLSPEDQEEWKSGKIIIEKDQVLLEYLDDGKIEREVENDLTKLPAIKINSFYFLPMEERYRNLIMKVNENNIQLLIQDGERFPLVRTSD
jgi:hypothetical protein